MKIDIFTQFLRIVLAIIVGSIIGFERMKLHKAAGVRTHAIITVICTMITMVSAYGFFGLSGNIDPTRLLSNIITGVGFLGGGVIYVTMKKDNTEEENVVGLNTAAGIFGAAMLGIPLGLGYYYLVVFTIIGMEFAFKTEWILKKFHISGNSKNDNRRD